MATKVNFGGKQVTLPNTYARIVSGVENPASPLDTGSLLVIDLGGNAGWGFGSGIDGENYQGIESFYQFTSLPQAKNVITGGKYSQYLDSLFFPANGVQGVPSVTFVKCATTTSASISKVFGTATFEAKTKFEGTFPNGTGSVELPAQWTFKTITVGDIGDTHSYIIDGVTIGTYDVLAGVDSPQAIASVMANLVNIGVTGYTAVVNGSDVLVTAPAGIGELANPYVVSYTTAGIAPPVGSVSLTKEAIDKLYLDKGFAMKILDSKTTGKFNAYFYKSTYSGINANDGLTYNEISLDKSAPQLIAKSKNVETVQELITWAKKDKGFNEYFIASDIVGADDALVVNTNWEFATGGTETYDVSLLDDLLEYVNKTDVEFITTTDYGQNALSASNVKLKEWVKNDSRYIRQFFTAGGNTDTEFESSKTIAVEMDSDLVTVVHSAIENVSDLSATGLRYWDAEAHLWFVLGRIGGLLPQNPITRKTLGFSKLISSLKDDKLEEALEFGVLVSEYNVDAKDIVVLQGVNTIQENDYLMNEDGSTFSIQLKRIDAFVNKTLMINANTTFLLSEEGANKKNLSEPLLTSFTRNELFDLEAGDLILGFRNIEASIEEDNAFISYEFEANSEITKIFFVGKRVIL